ncbi:uncharacterized protein LOC126913652 isoform X2 [Cygnus atratus]|uniref:uncharacterized protein LOC126913652 isoform X2 n=1 Tax=Cygnus atratus TaxID=8868 RepID=UPI0021B759B0|nr:uncharacterized protein LOC126913652 isoform X2 [Cygnus atratus]
MGEQIWGSDSDETVVEGSVAESDVEEEEFYRRRWLSVFNKDMDLTTEIKNNGGVSSPEIHFMHIAHDHMYGLKLKQIPQERYAPDQSQSLLQYQRAWISERFRRKAQSSHVFCGDEVQAVMKDLSIFITIQQRECWQHFIKGFLAFVSYVFMLSTAMILLVSGLLPPHGYLILLPF